MLGIGHRKFSADAGVPGVCRFGGFFRGIQDRFLRFTDVVARGEKRVFDYCKTH